MTKVATGRGLTPFSSVSRNHYYLINFKNERHFERSLAMWWIHALELHLNEANMTAAVKPLVYWSERHRCMMYCLKLHRDFVDR